MRGGTFASCSCTARAGCTSCRVAYCSCSGSPGCWYWRAARSTSSAARGRSTRCSHSWRRRSWAHRSCSSVCSRPRLAERGHEVTVAACRTDGAPAGEERDGKVSIVRIPATDVLDSRLNVPYPLPEPISAVRTLRRLVAGADVVNPQDALYATSVMTLAIARRRRVPSVLTQHVPLVPQRQRLLDVAQRAAVATLGRSARLATRVIS